MDELQRLGREARAELGAPSEAWLAAQKQRLFREPLDTPQPRRWLVPSLAFAALASVALIIALVGKRPTTSLPQVTTLTAAAEPQRVHLHDGSAAVLEAGARATVTSSSGGTRVELLHGSVEFLVVPQQGRSFTVVAGAFEVTVIGTRFSVQRETNGAVAVAVSHGVVSVRGPGRGPIRLAAGQRFRADPETTELAAAPTAPVDHATPTAGDRVPSAEAPPPRPALSATEPAREAVLPGADWETAYRERRYAAAVARAKEQGVERLLATLSAAKLAALADAARLGGDSELALRALQTVEGRFPGSPQAADAEFLVGRLHASRGDSASALTRLEKYLQRGDRAPYAVEAMGRLVELYSARGDTERAQRMAKRYLERAPDGPYRRLCLSVLQKP